MGLRKRRAGGKLKEEHIGEHRNNSSPILTSGIHDARIRVAECRSEDPDHEHSQLACCFSDFREKQLHDQYGHYQEEYIFHKFSSQSVGGSIELHAGTNQRSPTDQNGHPPPLRIAQENFPGSSLKEGKRI